MPKHRDKSKHRSDRSIYRRPLREQEITDLLDSSDDDLPVIDVEPEPEDYGGDERFQQEEVITRVLPVFIGEKVSSCL